MDKARQSINRLLDKTSRKEFQGNQWGRRHVDAWRVRSDPHAKAWRTILDGLAMYIDAHEQEFDSGLADDYFLMPYFLEIVSGLRGLLNGHLGRDIDAGTVERTIEAVCRAAGWDMYEDGRIEE